MPSLWVIAGQAGILSNLSSRASLPTTTSPVNDPQITFNDDFMIVKPQGIETKRMVMAPMGICAMTWPQQNISFVKYHPFKPYARYPQECNLAIYNAPSNLMSEMESFGEEQTVLQVIRSKTSKSGSYWIRKLNWQEPAQLAELFQ